MPKRIRHTGARSRKQWRVRSLRLTVECLESRTVLSAIVMPGHFAPEREFTPDPVASHFDSPQPAVNPAEIGMRPSADSGHDFRWMEQTPLPAPGPTHFNSAIEDVGLRPATTSLDDASGRGSASQRDLGLFDSQPRFDRGPVADSFWDTASEPDYQAASFADSTSLLQSSSYSTSAWSSAQPTDRTTPESGIVMTGVLHLEIVMPSSGMFFSLLAINTFAPPQGGLVALGSQSLETSQPRLGAFAASRARAPAPSENLSLNRLVAADSFDTIGSRVAVQLARAPGKQPVFNPLLEIPSSTATASSGEEGGLLRLSADQTVTISNWIGSDAIIAAPQGAPNATSVLTRIEPRFSESYDTLAQSDLYGLESDLNSAASLQMASIAGDMEGGMIDIGATRDASASLHEAALTPNRETIGKSTSQHNANEYAEQRRESDASRGDTLSASANSAASQPSEAKRHEADASNMAAGDQGGMIALVSPSISASGVPLSETGLPFSAQTAAGLTLTALGNGDVQMDAGVGLYQVFELGTAPGQLADQSVAGNRVTTVQPNPRAIATATTAAGGKHSAGLSHADNDGFGARFLRLAATIPAVLFLVSLPIRHSSWRKPATRIADTIRWFLRSRFGRPRG